MHFLYYFLKLTRLRSYELRLPELFSNDAVTLAIANHRSYSDSETRDSFIQINPVSCSDFKRHVTKRQRRLSIYRSVIFHASRNSNFCSACSTLFQICFILVFIQAVPNLTDQPWTKYLIIKANVWKCFISETFQFS